MNFSGYNCIRFLLIVCATMFWTSISYAQAQSDEIIAYGQVENLEPSSLVSKRLDENFEFIKEFAEIIDDDFDCLTGQFEEDTYHPSFDVNTGKQLCETVSLLISENLKIVKSYSELQFEQDKAGVNRFTKVLSHNTKIYENQRMQTWLIFFVTHIILIIGFLAALFELKKAHQLRSKGNEIHDELKRNLLSHSNEKPVTGEINKSPAELKTADIDVTLGYDRIALKTSINGVAIFVITIFYYLIYITFVYPITQGPDRPEIIETATAEQASEDN